MPTGSHGGPLHPDNLYPPLGRVRIAKSTYWDVPHKNCRISYPYDIFAAFVQPSTHNEENGLKPFFLPHQAVSRRYLWSQADGAPEVVNGLYLYPRNLDGDEAVVREVATMLGDHFEGQ